MAVRVKASERTSEGAEVGDTVHTAWCGESTGFGFMETEPES